MISSFITLTTVSWLAKYLFENKIIDAKYDICDCRLAYGGRTWTAKVKNEKEDFSNYGIADEMPEGKEGQYRNASFKLEEKL